MQNRPCLWKRQRDSVPQRRTWEATWEDEVNPISFCRANEADQVEKWNADVCGTQQSCTAECSQSSVSPSWARRDLLSWLVQMFFLRSSYLESQRSEMYPSDSSSHRWLNMKTQPVHYANLDCQCHALTFRFFLFYSAVLSSGIIFCSLHCSFPTFISSSPVIHVLIKPWACVFLLLFSVCRFCFPEISPVWSSVFFVFLPVFPVLLWFVLYLVFVSFVLSWICACLLTLFCCQLFCWVPFVFCI